MARERKKTTLSQYLVWALLALLGFSLIGFGVGGFGGSATSIATVAGRDVDAREYGRALQDELRALAERTGSTVTLDQARQLGVTQQVLSRLIATAAIDAEADRLGLSVSDERVARQIREIGAFQGAGGFDREAYAFALQNAGLTVPQFEEDVRREAARGLLSDAVAQAPAADAYADILVDYIGETRDVTWARVPPSALTTGVAEPTEAELSAWYLANEERFRLPPSKTLTVWHLSPETVARRLEPDEAAVRALYDANLDRFRRPERRLVERLVFPDRAAADAAAERIAAGESFDDLVAERGLELADIDLGDVERSGLGAAGDGVFALEGPGITGVLDSDLGPAIFRVNAVLSPIDVPFEEARAELEPAAALDAARRDIDARLGEFDDLLAGGATLEELAGETDVTLETLDWSEGSDEGLAAYPGFREVAQVAAPGDFPEVTRLEDGGLFALRVEEARDSRVPPLEEVEPQARAEMREARRTEALTELAAGYAERLAAGETPEGLELRSEEGLRRDAAPEGAPPGLVSAAFEAEPGAGGVSAGGGEVAIWRLDAVTPADPEAPRTALTREAALAQGRADMARDLLDAYVRGLQGRAEVQLNAAAIAGIEAQFP